MACGRPGGGHVGALLILLSTAVVVAFLDRYLWDYYYEKRRRTVIPRLLRDTVAIGHFPHRAPARPERRLSRGDAAQSGSARGSGVIAIILGFAAQNLLSSLFAGMSLQIGRPYKVGDWLKIGDQLRRSDGDQLGLDQVAHERRDHSLELPNNEIIKQTIVNLHYPTPSARIRLTIGVDYSVPPNRVKDALLRATIQAPGVENRAAAEGFPEGVRRLGDQLRDQVLDDDSRAATTKCCDAIYTNVWYEFKRRKINIPFPIRTLQIERKSSAGDARHAARARAILRTEPLFSCLTRRAAR